MKLMFISFTKISKLNQTGVYEWFASGSASVTGVWMNNKIRVGNINDLKDIDYLVSNHNMSFVKVYDRNGIYIYDVKNEEKYEDNYNNTLL